MWRRLNRLARLILRRNRVHDDMAVELQFHLEARAEDLTARGMSPDDARRRARLEFGSIESYKEATRQAAGLRLLSDLHADLRYATRLIRRQPGFALVAVLSLALGIGANTLVFSVINALVLQPLPVDRPDELVFVHTGHGGATVSFPVYRDIRDRNDTLSGAIGYRVAPMSFERDGQAARVWGYLATGNYFDVLGITPEAGRFFHQADDQPPTPSPLAVISDDCWARRFSRDPGALGKVIHVNGLPYTIIGVAPRGFVGTELFYRPEVWVPMTMQPQIEARMSWLDERGTQNTWMIARLRTGIAPAQALANLNAIGAALAREYPGSDDGLRFSLAKPGLLGDALRAPLRAFTFGVLALAGLVLVMACVNLAVMLTARGADRQRELAIRLSIGAGAGRLVRQLLAETLLLALAGGAAGVVLAWTAARALSAWQLPVEVPIQFDVQLDLWVLGFGVAVAVLAGLLFGLAPARQAARTDANSALKGLESAHRPRRWAVRDLLVAVQVTLCVVLMAGCLLALQGLRHALTMNLGFNPRGVALVGFDLGLAGYDESHGRDFNERAVTAVRTLPGVESAAYSDTLPLNIDQSTTMVLPEDRADLSPAEAPSASRFRVSPGYFKTMGTRIVQGREIDARDIAGGPPVAVVNETFARRILRTADAVGRRFRHGWSGRWIEVVGVAEDGKYQTLTESPRAAVFEAIAQHYSTSNTLVARSSLPPDRLVTEMRATLSNLDPRLALYETESVEDMLGFALFPSRVAAVALGAFGVLAVILAVTGLHGVVSNAVAKRRTEIGLRIAIGAPRGAVVRLVLTRTVMLLAGGALAGTSLVLIGGQLLAGIVYGVSPRDPVVLTAVGLSLVVVGALSCWAPVRRALGVSPIVALRAE